MLSHISNSSMCVIHRNFKLMSKCWFAIKKVMLGESRYGLIIMINWIFALVTVFMKVIPSMKFRQFQRVWKLDRKGS